MGPRIWTWPAAAAVLALLAGPGAAQDGPRDGEPFHEHRHGSGPQERLAAIDGLGRDLAMNPEQARLFGDVRTTAVKLMRDRRPPRPADPFARMDPPEVDRQAVESDRAAMQASGSRFFATLDARQRDLVSSRWHDTFGPLKGGGRGRGEPR